MCLDTGFKGEVYLTLFFMLIDLVVDQWLNSVFAIGTKRRKDERGWELSFIIFFFYLIHINYFFNFLTIWCFFYNNSKTVLILLAIS